MAPRRGGRHSATNGDPSWFSWEITRQFRQRWRPARRWRCTAARPGQFWGLGLRPQRQQPRSAAAPSAPVSGFFGRPAPRAPRARSPVDYSRAPLRRASRKRRRRPPDVVMGDAMADWLAYGLEEAFAEKPEFGIVRKHRADLRPHPLRARAANRMGADRARDHRGRKAEIPRHDDRHQRPPGDPRARTPLRPPAPGVEGRAHGPAGRPAAENSASGQQIPRTAAEKSRSRRAGGRRRSSPRAPARRLRIPYGKMGSRLYQPHRCHDRRDEERGRSGVLGRAAGAARPAAPPPTRPISTSFFAAARKRPGSSLSTSGTALSTSPAATRRKDRISKVRFAGCDPATASFSPEPAPASSHTLSSAKSSGAWSTAPCRWRCRRKRSHAAVAATGTRPSGPSHVQLTGPVVPLTALLKQQRTPQLLGGGRAPSNRPPRPPIRWPCACSPRASR